MFDWREHNKINRIKFNKIKEKNPNSRIGKRSRDEQKTRNKLAKIILKERKYEKRGEKISESTEETKKKLEDKIQDFKIHEISRIIDTEDFTESNLEFLESLSYDDLSKIEKFNQRRVGGIYHTLESEGVTVKSWSPYCGKYIFLYEISRDKTLINEDRKKDLKEKAKQEARDIICGEIANDTFLYNWRPNTLEHIFEYVPQKVVANKLRWTGNSYVTSDIGVLRDSIKYFTELDDNYKEEIKSEYEEYKEYYSYHSYGDIDYDKRKENKEKFNNWLVEEGLTRYKS